MLVIDDLDSHDAHQLCESPISDGPNFVNPKHGFYCDMQTKNLYQLCKSQNNNDASSVCFDMEQTEL
ncbi:hypothetical protein diail_11174, partial [Diaporthe ilicicola]